MGKAFQAEPRNEDCMVKLILAHRGAAMQTLDHFWWATGIGGKIVEMSTRDLDTGKAGISRTSWMLSAGLANVMGLRRNDLSRAIRSIYLQRSHAIVL